MASGSAGNAYLVSDKNTTLLLECGIPYRELMRRSGYQLSRIAACLITHEHGDHAKAARNLLAAGIQVYCSAGTAAALGIADLPGARPLLRHLRPTIIGTMAVLPVSVYHDAAEPLGWLIASQTDGEHLIFLTDTSRVEYRFPPAEHIMIECNYTDDDSMAHTNAYLARRILDNHLGLEGCLRFLKAQDLHTVQDIWLIHLSRSHGDPDLMRRAVSAATGKRVLIAK